MEISISVRGWVPGGHLDTADTFSVNGGDLDVSLVTPSSSPGVSDDPVEDWVALSVLLLSESDGGDSVVGLALVLVSASLSVIDTRLVLVEAVVDPD